MCKIRNVFILYLYNNNFIIILILLLLLTIKLLPSNKLYVQKNNFYLSLSYFLLNYY